MAKKDEGLTYLQVPLPKEYKKSRLVKKTWSGYNRRQTVDTGMLSYESNISTEETPYLVPSKVHSQKHGRNNNTKAFGVFAFEQFVLLLYTVSSSEEKTSVYVSTVKTDGYTPYVNYNAPLGTFNNDEQIPIPHAVIFNRYTSPTDPIEGEFEKYLLFFPFNKSVKIENGFPVTEISPSGNARLETKTITGMPDIKYATVHLSRLFGVDGERIYASGFNDYANWKIDTVDTYDESGAWCSTAGSNTKAGGEFTGITAFQNHVVCFKKDFMHEVYNTKNPFRIQDVYAEGCLDNRTIQDVDGQLIFVSEDAVKVYTGSNPRIISSNLGVKTFVNPVSGTDGRNYYLYCKDENDKKHVFVYDTHCGQWSERDVPASREIVMFSYNGKKLFYAYTDFLEDGTPRARLGEYEGGDYDYWSFETDLITSESCDVKHIEKFQMFCDINEGANLSVYFLYDDESFDENTSQKVWSIENAAEDMQKVIRVKPRMTAHHGFKVHVEGNGFVRIRSMELLIQGGGELYV